MNAAQRWLVILTGCLVLVACGSALLRLAVSMSDTPVAASTIPPRVRDSSGPSLTVSWPAEVLLAARVYATVMAPTPEPTPPPTYVSTIPTITPRPVCGPWLSDGEVCTMPKAPLPTPTPMPTCPVAPESTCIWRGSHMGTPLAPSDVASPAPWLPR